MLSTIFIYIFWLLLFLVGFTYVGYGLVLYLMVRIKRILHKPCTHTTETLPSVTLLIPAYNEENIIKEKLSNSLRLNYPKELLKIIVITDGSTDKTPEIVRQFNDITLMHQTARQGKNAAVERAIKQVDTEVTIFTDANALLNRDALFNLARHFANPAVGAVAGEKRIVSDDTDAASGAGEGIYWKYESQLKKWDSELNTVVGAAGELFAIRTSLYPDVPKDTIIEDFFITLQIASQGFKVVYEPAAYAMEKPSTSVAEELKRKIRIAAGGLQAIARLKTLLNPFKYGLLSFQFVAHRVLRWTLAPLALPIIFIINLYLAIDGQVAYILLFILQCLFYLAALLGWWMENKKISIKIMFVPYYFCVMNYAVYAGFLRYINGSQSVLWEKSRRQ